jgi:hypothetical protein
VAERSSRRTKDDIAACASTFPPSVRVLFHFKAAVKTDVLQLSHRMADARQIEKEKDDDNIDGAMASIIMQGVGAQF